MVHPAIAECAKRHTLNPGPGQKRGIGLQHTQVGGVYLKSAWPGAQQGHHRHGAFCHHPACQT